MPSNRGQEGVYTKVGRYEYDTDTWYYTRYGYHTRYVVLYAIRSMIRTSRYAVQYVADTLSRYAVDTMSKLYTVLTKMCKVFLENVFLHHLLVSY